MRSTHDTRAHTPKTMTQANKTTLFIRSFLLSTWPMMLYGVIYFSLGLLPRSSVIDVQPLYELERSLFGISVDGMTAIDGSETLTFAEYFSAHHWVWADIWAGVCYICWVPVPILFTLYLYFMGFHRHTLCFALTFLTMNIIGFTINMIHPAAAPWYVMEHGFEVLPETASNAAGLLRFDALVGAPVFASLYRGSTNVFGAFPSLHAAKMSMVCLYSVLVFEKDRRPSTFIWAVLSLIITLGTWFAAIYTAHHYIIDVLAGIVCVALGYLLFAYGIRRTPPFRWINNRLSNNWFEPAN